MKPKLILFALIAMSLAGCGRPQMPNPPPWVSGKFDVLRRIGIDPGADFVKAANYHWSWTSRRELVAGA